MNPNLKVGQALGLPLLGVSVVKQVLSPSRWTTFSRGRDSYTFRRKIKFRQREPTP